MTRNGLRRPTLKYYTAGLSSLCLLILILSTIPGRAQEETIQNGQGTHWEAVRQELVRQKLNDLTNGIEHLIRDMKSNGLLDDHNQQELARLKRRIKIVNQQRVKKAAEALRQAKAPDYPDNRLTEAERLIDLAAREIGSMMIQLGVRYANEVFGRELHELVVIQSELYIKTIKNIRHDKDGTEASWKEQSRMADQTVQLLAEMSDVEEYGTDALAMVRLARIISKLHETQIELTLQGAANDLRQGALDSAVSAQRQALDVLMMAEFRVLPGSEMRALVEARDKLRKIRNEQRNLRDALTRWDQETLQRRQSEAEEQQTALRYRVEEIIAPPILEEKIQLAEEVLRATGLETSMSDIEPIDPFLDEAQARMSEATGHIEKKVTKAAGEAQLAAESSLDKAIEMLQMRIDAAMHLNSIFRKLQDAIQRLKKINDLIDHQTELKEEAEKAEAENSATRQLALPQDNLRSEVELFKGKITSENQELEVPSDFVPLVARHLDSARGHMIDAVIPLKNDNPVDSVPVQMRALSALMEARDIAEQEVNLLDRLWQLLEAVKDLESFQQYLNDLESEQRQLREKTAQADQNSLPGLASPQHRLAAAAKQVRGILDPGQVNLSKLGGILEEVTAEMNAAEQRINDGQAPAAVTRQREAEKQIRKASLEITRLAEELDYLAEWLEFLKQLNADALDLLQRQTMLRLETEEAEIAAFNELAGEQDVLLTEAESFAQFFPIGAADYAKAAEHMNNAITTGLNKEDRIEALKQMALAEDALTRAIKQLAAAMEALDQIPMLSLMDKPPEELQIITRLMLLVSRQGSLRRKTRAASTDAAVVRFEQPQQELLDEARAIAVTAKAEEMPDMPLLTKSEHEMEAARDALALPYRAESVRHQQLAEKYLRKLVLEMILENFELPKQLEKKRAMSVISLMPPTMTIESEKAFAKEAVEGDISGSDRTEWRVLGQRDRSALNQNFARELPLEYREMLRVYFERLGE